MKKHTFLNILLAGAMLIGISACDDHENDKSTKVVKVSTVVAGSHPSTIALRSF